MPTASEPKSAVAPRKGRPPRKPFAPKWLVVLHRYFGIVFGLLMLIWFASGIVMLFVRWPGVDDDDRARALAPIPWAGCCVFGEAQGAEIVPRGVVEEMAGRPMLRVGGEVTDLATGRPLAPLSEAEARRVAATYAAAQGVKGKPAAAERIERDQWTVTGYFNKRRPYWRVDFDDARATQIHVSAKTGEVAQFTDRPHRILAWLGPIPHWLYPEVLRADGKLWTQVVIWTSLAGGFLTITGLYLGIIAWRPRRDAQLTPYRGLMAWHHLGGLAAGVLTLTWVVSGTLSMGPWGVFDSPEDPRPARIAGEVTLSDVRSAVAAAQADGIPVRRLVAAPLEGQVFLMADEARRDAEARPAPLTTADLQRLAGRLGNVRAHALITHEDAYYRGHHEPVRLPVYRVEMTDGVRFYLDPASGRLLASVNGRDKANRWLFEGLHRLDVIPGFDRGPGWAAAMIVLLLAAALGVATGVWLGWRRAVHDVERLRSKKASLPG
ncbi:MAG: peptidase [Phenylobacterium zucineum]|nr:MAG: peptidase [Phenylobacterium zucineum]